MNLKLTSSLFIVFFSAAFCCCQAHAAPQAGRVEGRVMYNGQPVEGASVYAAKEPRGIFDVKDKTPSAVTDRDGAYALTLPRGQYFIAAVKGRPGGAAPAPGELYCFYGGNPLSVDPARPARAVLNMAAKPAAKDDVTGGEKGGVEGTVTFGGAPQDGVVLFVYLDANEGFRGLGYYMSPPTGVDGSFKMKMGEGTYYIIARKRLSGEMAGPLKEGDFFGYLDTNPVVVRKGVTKRVEIPLVKKQEKASPGGQGRTAVSGFIRGKDGGPLAGMYACLYKNAGMTDRPAFVSKPTGPDGAFLIEPPLGGTYYLGARSVIGLPVEPGQMWGKYNGTDDHSVSVETGKTVERLEITAEKITE